MTTPPPPAPRPGADPGAHGAAPIDRRRLVTTMTWVVLALVPVLWVVELMGPEWLNLVLRGLWVLLAVGTVLGGIRVMWGHRRPGGSGTPRR